MTSNTVSRIGYELAVPSAPRPEEVLQALEVIDQSGEPLAVFSSIARLCVPDFCDAATVTVVGPDGRGHRIEASSVRPVTGPVPIPPKLTVTDLGQTSWVESARPHAEGDSAAASFSEAAGDLRGELVLWFRRKRSVDDHTVSADLLARLLVDRAVTIVQREQLTAIASAANARADNLEVALASSRDIGMAIGILMERFKLSSEQGFDLIVRISQHDRRKVRDIAHGITETGEVVLPPEVELIARPASAQPAASSANQGLISGAAGRPGPGRPTPSRLRPGHN